MLIVTLIIIQVVVFTSLVLFLRGILSRNVTVATAHLDEMAHEYAKKEEEINKQLQEAKRESGEIVLTAQKEAREQKEQILKEAQEERERVLSAAHEKAQETIQQADRARQALIAEMEQKIEDRAIDKSGQILADALPEHIRKEIHQRWLDDLISSSFQQLDRLHIPEGIHQVKVISAFELSARQRDALVAKMKERLGHQIELTQEISPDIIAGLVINIGSLVFDGSLKLKIQEVARAQQSNV